MKFAILPLALLAIVTTSGIQSGAQNSPNQTKDLYQSFLNPPHDYSLMPFWFWNGKMEGPVIQQEIRDMVDQHVYGAFLHARDGLETPYLSEEWWKTIGAGLQQAKSSGFEFNFVDEYDWPSGEVRNVWMSGNHQSEVLAKRPNLRMQTLAYESQFVTGPRTIDITVNPDSEAIVASRWLGNDQIDASTMTLIAPAGNGNHIQWSAPDGQWVITQFALKPAMGFDGGFVDLLNPDTTNLFFKLVYGEYHRRFPTYFGSTIRYGFSDHEGDYGYRIAWTPKLFAEFQQRAGYDLRKTLPLLIYSGGNETSKVRTDYLATITGIYGSTFWRGITKSAASLGLGRTGHAWEESLQWSAALQGSLFAVERGLNPVGVDSLEDFGRQPLNFKVAQSVADFEGRRFACENQGVQGTNSYLDMEGIRKATNGIGAWGVNLFIPHAFDYDAGRANYPPDWLHQPYWPYFHEYADYTRRISYMNSDSHHVTNVLLYYPITTLWTETQPLFSGKTSYQQIGEPVAWKNNSVLINDYYTRIILQLSNHHWDYNIADDDYFASARIEGNELVIGPQRFRAVILPPITTLSRATLAKLQAFHKAGGIILGIKILPTGSPDKGGDDPVIKAGIVSIFGRSEENNASSGSADSTLPESNSFYIDNSVDDLIAALDAHVPKDVKVLSGPAQHLFFQHRIKAQTDYYWVVNDTDRNRENNIHFAASGIPEKWDARTGKQEPLFYTNAAFGTDLRIELAPWDAFYVVFRPLTGPPQDAHLIATNAEAVDTLTHHNNEISVHVAGPMNSNPTFVELRSAGVTYNGAVPKESIQPLALNGSWQFRPKPDRISVPYAREENATEAQGKALGWTSAEFDDTNWPEMWLNEEQTTIRHWQMIGPFPNTDNNGFAKIYPPEQEFDVHKSYEGLNGPITWHDYDGNEPYLALNDWSIWMKTYGGRSSDSGYITQFNPELLTDGESWIVSYAHTYLYSPQEQQAQFIVAADNWSSIWLNHKQVFAQLRTPFWYELNDNWADRVPVSLHQGWNDVLVKVGKGRGTSSGFYGFSFRVADDKGNTLSSVVASVSSVRPSVTEAANETKHWYRIFVPPGCTGVVPPKLHGPYNIFLNGKELHSNGDSSIDMRTGLHGEENTLVIVASSNDPLVTPIQFVSGETSFSLKPWTKTGLANFSGTAIYTKTFTVPASFRDKRVMLDLGQVSSVADVFVNGKPAGDLVWRPYQLDISKLIHPGTNELKILVTDTEANGRAVGTWHHILPAIDLSGMVGPVQIIPYVDQVLTLHPVGSASMQP